MTGNQSKPVRKVCSNCAHFGGGGSARRHRDKCALTGLTVLPIMQGCPMYSRHATVRAMPKKSYVVELVADTIELGKGEK